MTLTSRNARIAGFLYLLLVLAAPLRLMYIPTVLFVSGDAGATAANILAHEGLFRLGIVADLFSGAIVVFVVLALYRLFKDVDRKQAVLMVVLGLVPDIIYYFNVLNDFAVLLLLHGGDYLAAFSKPQLDGLAMLFLKLHSQEIIAAETFWGLWLFPLAVLVLHSRHLPRFIGIWLVLNGLGYVLLSLTGVLLPQLADTLSNYIFPLQLGEIALMLWLLLMGAHERRPALAGAPA